MLLIDPVQSLVGALPSFLPVVIVGTAATDAKFWWFALPLIGLALVVGVLTWWKTEYRITSSQLQLRRGLLQRNTLTAPLDRIRTVDVTASPLHRLLGVATVKIGTGSDEPFKLDGLSASESQALRSALLHVSRAAAPSQGTTAATGDALPPGAEFSDVELSRLSPAWLRYAPFTLSGAVAVLAAMGFLGQYIDEIGEKALESALGASVVDYVQHTPWWLSLIEGVAAALVVLLTASMTTYVLMYWNYSLTRHPGGTLGVRRGLLTTRHTTVEETRLRGVTLVRPLLLRWVGAAKADVMVTGLSGGAEATSSSSDLLVPPAPLAEAVRVAGAVLGDPEPITCALQQHGTAAARRRYTRAFTAAALVVIPSWVALWIAEMPWWSAVLAATPLLLAAPIAKGRYAMLGHALTSGHLVAASGLFPHERSVLRRSAIIGWTMQSSFFQRRRGLVTLKATVAASAAEIVILDVPQARAVQIMQAATPGLVEPYLDRLRSRTGTRS